MSLLSSGFSELREGVRVSSSSKFYFYLCRVGCHQLIEIRYYSDAVTKEKHENDVNGDARKGDFSLPKRCGTICLILRGVFMTRSLKKKRAFNRKTLIHS